MPLEILDSSSFFSPEMLSLLAFCGNCDILCAVHSDCAPSGECGVGTSFYHTSKITMDFLFSSVQLHYAINLSFFFVFFRLFLWTNPPVYNIIIFTWRNRFVLWLCLDHSRLRERGCGRLNSEFSRILTLLRKEKGVSQKAAAASLGVSQALLSHYAVSYTHLDVYKRQPPRR